MFERAPSPEEYLQSIVANIFSLCRENKGFYESESGIEVSTKHDDWRIVYRPANDQVIETVAVEKNFDSLDNPMYYFFAGGSSLVVKNENLDIGADGSPVYEIMNEQIVTNPLEIEFVYQVVAKAQSTWTRRSRRSLDSLNEESL